MLENHRVYTICVHVIFHSCSLLMNSVSRGFKYPEKNVWPLFLYLNIPYRPFLAGLTMERSLQGLPPITKSNGPHSSI